MEDLMGILAIVGFFGSIFGIVYIVRSASHKEKMAMIDKGADPSLFRRQLKSSNYMVFKAGLFLIGVGFGIIAAQFVGNVIDPVAAHFSMILLFGGAALVLAYYMQRKMEQQEG